MKRTIIVLSILSILGTVGFSASFSAWVGMTGQGKFALNPFIYLPTSFDSVSADLVIGYGFTDNIDILANLSSISLSGNGFNWSGAWIMPRYDFGKSDLLPYNIVALQVGYIGSILASLQYHTLIKPVDILGIELNLIGTFITSTPELLISIIIAPVLNIVGPLSIYFEFDPSFGLSTGFGYTIIGGIDINLGNIGEISIGYNITSSTLVGWYFITF
ncbi:MAG: hypothetical protein N2712_03780 [Brevinematales bacterium]|nr:hypothetical protein [Brevinematales bacterium]